MTHADIELMLAEKGRPCLSIIIATKKPGHERQQNHELIEKAIARAQILVKHSAWPKDDINLLQGRLKLLQGKVEQLPLAEGLAIFISPNIFKIFPLPFSVTGKVILDNSFEVRDLVYLNQFLRPYYLITVSKSRVRLFRGSGRDLQEIINNDFPKTYVEEYEYARPSIGSSSSAGLKSFERDKSVMSNIRVQAFFRSADEMLKKYVKVQTLLFVAGVADEINNFEKVSSHAKQIASRIRGNYDVDAVHPLAEMAWNKIKREIQVSNRELLLKLDDAVGRHLAVDGIVNVWKAATDGQGHILLIEKDYMQRAYLNSDNPEHLSLFPPAGKYEMVQDAADDVIELVRKKGGSVAVVENGELSKFQRIALILRYP